MFPSRITDLFKVMKSIRLYRTESRICSTTKNTSMFIDDTTQLVHCIELEDSTLVTFELTCWERADLLALVCGV